MSEENEAYERKCENYSTRDLEGILQSLNRDRFPERYQIALKHLEQRRLQTQSPEAVKKSAEDEKKRRQRFFRLAPLGLFLLALAFYLLFFPPWSNLGHCFRINGAGLCRNQEGEWMSAAESERRWQELGTVNADSLAADPTHEAVSTLRARISKHLGDEASTVSVSYMKGTEDNALTVEIGTPNASGVEGLWAQRLAVLQMVRDAHGGSEALKEFDSINIRIGQLEGFELAEGYGEETHKLN